MFKRKKKRENNFIDLVCRIFEACGIQINGELKVSRRYLGEGIVRTIRIHTIDTYVRLFGEGQYIIEGEDVVIKGVDTEPFNINYMCIEGEYENSKWNLAVRMDEEEILYTELDRLDLRSVEIAQKAQTGLETLTSLLRLADKVFDFQDFMTNAPT